MALRTVQDQFTSIVVLRDALWAGLLTFHVARPEVSVRS
jgi:hypothetical protein